MEDLSWRDQAKCVGMGDLFYPPPSSENSKMRTKRERSAIAVCKTCPVMLQCRNYARSHDELGIWGGETEKERWLGGYITVGSAIFRRRPPDYYSNRKAKKLLSADAILDEEQLHDRTAQEQRVP